MPHTLDTWVGAVNLYRYTHDIDFVLRRYHISKASLMHWNKQFDGTRESLLDKSHRPHSQHPNAHTEEELKWIRDYHHGKLLQEKGCRRHPGSLYRFFVRLGCRRKVESTRKKSKHMEHYDTPTELGKKWQMDVKHVPTACYVGQDGEKFCQYTRIDEATRERFIYAYKEASNYSTVDFVQRAIRYFGYAPEITQTDNGGEFTHTGKTKRMHPLDVLCSRLHIIHNTP